MIATVRDERGVTHVAIRIPDGKPLHERPVIGALCEDTIKILLCGMFTTWTIDEVSEGVSDCMSCLVFDARNE